MEKYDHIESPCIDVRKNAEGEFVQVWDAPFKTPGRNLLLTYQRNGTHITSISRHERPEKGLYSHIIFYEGQTTYYYRDHQNKLRTEKQLENGSLLVRDEILDLNIESIFTVEFDFVNLKPKGRKLGDRGVMKLQRELKEYFISTYQYSSELGPQLAIVEKYLGSKAIEKWEFDFTPVN